jgi:hypothetical protein
MQPMQQANASGRSMLDGSVDTKDHHLTEFNRERVLSFVTDILLARKLALLPDYVCHDNFIQHSPLFADGIAALRSALSNQSKTNTKSHILKFIVYWLKETLS